MSWLPLPIFPEGVLSASVIVTVWIGITVVAITNLRLGWVLSGLVVPGYMVPLLMVKPVAAGVVFAEGILTYFLVWLYSEYLPRFTGYSNLFGRDRFLALVLASVAVRIVADGWLLPVTGAWLQANTDFAFDYRSNLHSFGLIIVALIANNFWKTGLLRGAFPMAIQVGITWLIVRYVLMEYTNFNMASLGYMYEDAASSFLATPKAYIVIVVTAFIASRLNLFYGWDFSGILIPSLLALEWFEPHKIVTTLVEAVVILVAAEYTLRLPLFRKITMEGARKLLLFFNISFIYKFLVAWGVIYLMPGTKTTDWFGFGYLLATLLALKMHDKAIFARMTRATLQTSLTGMIVATLVGFVLIMIPDPEWRMQESAGVAVLAPIKSDQRSIDAALQSRKTSLYAASLGSGMSVPVQWELDAFSAGLRELVQYRRLLDPAVLENARRLLAGANYDVEHVAGQFLLLRERAPARHWGTYVVRTGGNSPLMVQVPSPLDEPGAFDAGAAVFRESGARAFASAGASRRANPDGSADVLAAPQTMFQAFHRELALAEVIQVRGEESGRAVLKVSGQIPAGLNLRGLEKALPALRVEFSALSGRNLQRQTMRGSFSELWLSQSDAYQVRLLGTAQQALAPELVPINIGAVLRSEITEQSVAAAGSNAYRAPRPEELLRLDRDVLAPLLRLAATAPASADLPGKMSATLAALTVDSATLGLNLRWLRDRRGTYVMLTDHTDHRGWIVVRMGPADNLIIEVPRPVVEPGILEAGLNAFDDLRARVIVIAGAAPDANADGSADLLALNNANSLYTLTHQVALREMGMAPGIALVMRAFAVRPGQPVPLEDAVLSTDTTIDNRAQLQGNLAELLHSLERSGLTVRLGGGGVDTGGYEATGGPQAGYMNQTREKRFAVLWISPVTRRQANLEAIVQQQRQFTALGLGTSQDDVIALLSRHAMSKVPLPEILRSSAELFAATGDIVILSDLQRHYPRGRLERVDDAGGRGAYLLFMDADGLLQGVLSLAPRVREQAVEQRVQQTQPGQISIEEARRFVSSRTRWMMPG